jgi:hypothetical protein
MAVCSEGFLPTHSHDCLPNILLFIWISFSWKRIQKDYFCGNWQYPVAAETENQ